MWKGRDLFQKRVSSSWCGKREGKNACVTVDETTPAAFQRCRTSRVSLLYPLFKSWIDPFFLLLFFVPTPPMSWHILISPVTDKKPEGGPGGVGGGQKWHHSPHTHIADRASPGRFQLSPPGAHTHTHTRSSDERKNNKTLWECSRSFVLRATDEFEGSVLNLFSFPPKKLRPDTKFLKGDMKGPLPVRFVCVWHAFPIWLYTQNRQICPKGIWSQDSQSPFCFWPIRGLLLLLNIPSPPRACISWWFVIFFPFRRKWKYHVDGQRGRTVS
jgi:hypothetical protein